jgi:cell division protein FtsI/penicillin-binding protein 2
MARVAATIATGKIPQPYLINQWDNKTLDPARPRPLKLTLIDYLRQGMKAVPEVGTARAAFQRFYKHGRCRTYGKTGTAQVARGKKKAPYNSAWFIGWHEDKQGKADVSFACMVTHAYAKGKRSGGAVCAPIIARILSDLEKAKKEAK